ncbi:MAG: outer membrane protein [Bradyrhizobium sp.]|jgi:outer membrane immunogenic protein
MKKIIVATVLAAVGSTAALAADLGARAPYAKAPAMVAVGNWSGFYIGANVGYGWGSGHTEIVGLPDPEFGLPRTALDTNPKGVIGGAQIGYNWQVGSLVTGLEADIQGSGIKGSTSRTVSIGGGPATLTASEKLNWFGTVRGRLGFAATPDLLLYGTGGLAYGEFENSGSINFPNIQYPATAGSTKVGWTVGAGAEWMLARTWSVKAEYLYMDLGSASAIGRSPLNRSFQSQSTWHHQDHIVRAGVNYHF